VEEVVGEEEDVKMAINHDVGEERVLSETSLSLVCFVVVFKFRNYVKVMTRVRLLTGYANHKKASK
jgi:hypothetical protein